MLIAVVLAVIVLSPDDSALAPIFFLLSDIGMAIVCNLSTSVFFKERFPVTQALAAVLQLGVTMVIHFIWHSYEKSDQRGAFSGR